jgi:hypothetical protein
MLIGYCAPQMRLMSPMRRGQPDLPATARGSHPVRTRSLPSRGSTRIRTVRTQQFAVTRTGSSPPSIRPATDSPGIPDRRRGQIPPPRPPAQARRHPIHPPSRTHVVFKQPLCRKRDRRCSASPRSHRRHALPQVPVRWRRTLHRRRLAWLDPQAAPEVCATAHPPIRKARPTAPTASCAVYGQLRGRVAISWRHPQAEMPCVRGLVGPRCALVAK